MGSLMLFSIATKGGAPMASCKDLAPTILAFSKRVNFGGPTLISKPSKRGFLIVFFADLEGVGTKGCLQRCYRLGSPRIKLAHTAGPKNSVASRNETKISR